MIYFLGNCHVFSILKSPLFSNVEKAYRRIASTVFFEEQDLAPERKEFYQKAIALGMDKHLNSRVLLGPLLLHHEKPPHFIVINMFNERPVLEHNSEGYHISASPNMLDGCTSEQQDWLRGEFTPVEIDPDDYLERFGRMLVLLRRMYPQAPIILLLRLSHFPRYGPNPRSLLAVWETGWERSFRWVKQILQEVDQLIPIPMDLVLSELCEQHHVEIDTFGSFIKYEVIEKRNGTEVRMRRDIEHMDQPLWNAAAQKVHQIMIGGQVLFPQTTDKYFYRPFEPEKISFQTLQQLLNSGRNYATARALAYFFYMPKYDFAPVINTFGEVIPIDQSVLHMIKSYASVRPNPVLADFCQTHRKKLHQTMGFREQGFIDRYDREIDQIEALWAN